MDEHNDADDVVNPADYDPDAEDEGVLERQQGGGGDRTGREPFDFLDEDEGKLPDDGDDEVVVAHRTSTNGDAEQVNQPEGGY